MSLEYSAFVWLRTEKHCPVALFQRSPRANIAGYPDICGVTKAGYLLEIEVKRSISDFRANAKKAHIRRRTEIEIRGSDESGYWSLKNYPKQFWFLVPENLIDKVKPELPNWAGLLTEADPKTGMWIQCVVNAPSNELSSRLTPREMISLGKSMSNLIWSQAKTIEALAERRSEYVPENCMALLV